MALINTEQLAAQASGFGALPVVRQIALLVGLAASIALGFAVVLWSQTPNYSPLYGPMANTEAAEVIDALERQGVPFRLEQGSGIVSVPASQLHEARLKLATLGLPKSDSGGFELLDEKQGFGTSQFMEQARYNRALEGELARSIATLRSVESARVHLALPKRSVFLRDKAKPRASVVLALYSGTTLDDTRLAGIVHLVAASVPGLEPDQVTVVDQKGHLLTASQGLHEITMSANQLNHTRRLEQLYVKRIHDLLSPIVGVGGVRAEVVADVDFTVTEKTAESYSPENRVVRSEETIEEQTSGKGPAGIPGALTNQPPPAGTVAPEDKDAESTVPLNSTRQATRNYEIDRSVVHTRSAPGKIRRLSVAVVVDHRTIKDEAGKLRRVPLSAEDLQQLTALVKKAVGFDTDRNDSVNVTNIPFQPEAAVEPPPPLPFWKKPWLWDVVKQAGGVVLVLLLGIGILRPVLRNLSNYKPPVGAGSPDGMLPGMQAMAQLPPGQAQSAPGTMQAVGMPATTQSFDMAKSLIENDPKQVARVMKNWVANDG